MMNSQGKEVMHNINNKRNTSPMPTFMPTPNEVSRTFHSFPLGGSNPSALPRSKSLGFKPNRVRNSHWSSIISQTGLGAVGDLARAAEINKNFLVRPLMTGQRDPPVSPDGAHSEGLCSKLGQFFLQSFGTKVSKADEPPQERSGDQDINSGNRNPILNDHVLVDKQTYNPRKKAKKSENVDVKEESFMNYCFGCHKRLKENEDIYIYRGEMAFCSPECREREIFIQEKTQKEASSSSKKPTIRDISEG